MYYIVRTESGYEVYRHGQLVADVSGLDEALAVVGSAPYTRTCAAEWRMQP